MRKKRIFGWTIIGIGVLGLIISILHEYNINIGPFEAIYHVLDWFTLSAFMDLIWLSFSFVFNFISRHFWMLIMICLGVALVFGAKRQEQYDHDLQFDYNTQERHDRLHHTLCRNLDDMKLAGVCSGLARKFEIDPTIIRIFVLFMALSSFGTVFLVYLLLAFLLPGEHLG